MPKAEKAKKQARKPKSQLHEGKHLESTKTLTKGTHISTAHLQVR